MDMEKINSRGAFFKSISNYFLGNSSESAPNPEKLNKSFELVIELLCAFSLMYQGYLETEQKIVTHGVDAETKLAEHSLRYEMQRVIEERKDIFNGLLTELQTLRSMWGNEYYKSHQETRQRTVQKCDSEGVCTTETEEYEETVWEWEEPSQLKNIGLNNEVLTRWIADIQQYSRSLTHLLKVLDGTYDLDAGSDTVFLTEKQVGSRGRSIALLGVYGAAAAALCWYEEIFDLIVENTNIIYEKIASVRVSRRTFLKGIASLAVLPLIAKARKVFALNNSKSGMKIRDEIAQVVSKLDVSPEESFKRYLGISVDHLRRDLQSIGSVGDASLGATVYDRGWDVRIKPVMERVLQVLTGAQDDFNRKYSANSPKEITDLRLLQKVMGYQWATEEIGSIVQGENTQTILMPFWNILGKLGIWTLIMGVGEVIFPMTDNMTEGVQERVHAFIQNTLNAQKS
jgi:hypothetical protein